MGQLDQRKPRQDVMPCGMTSESIDQLEHAGWEYLYSFHADIPEQWSMACEKAAEAKRFGFYQVTMVDGQDDAERKDNVRYLYKKKTEILTKLEDQHLKP